jgi:hypothetical protein
MSSADRSVPTFMLSNCCQLLLTASSNAVLVCVVALTQSWTVAAAVVDSQCVVTVDSTCYCYACVARAIARHSARHRVPRQF